MSHKLWPYVEGWHPSTARATEVLELGPVRGLAHALDYDDETIGSITELPPFWHWLFFLHWPARRNTARDGHPAQAALLPPIPDRRRMWGGGRWLAHQPLLMGIAAKQTVTVTSIRPVAAASGDLLIVTTRSTLEQRGRICVEEETDIVYRSGASTRRADVAPTTAPAPTPNATWGRRWTTDETLLFRFSALTANSHRIHYDRDYARASEHYPDIVVQGPLLVILMADALRKPGLSSLRRFSYRLRAPIFVNEPLSIDGSEVAADGSADLRAATHRLPGHVTAKAHLS